MWSDYYEPKLYVYGAAAGRVTAMEGEAPSAAPSAPHEQCCQPAAMASVHRTPRLAAETATTTAAAATTRAQ